MRNPFVRAVALAVVTLVIFMATLHGGSADLRRAVMVTSTSFRQQPLSEQGFRQAGHKLNSTVASSTTKSWDPETLSCQDDLHHMHELRDRYGLQPTFEYFKRHIQVSRAPIERKSLTDLNQSFMPRKFRLIDTEDGTTSEESCPGPEPLRVQVPNSPFPAAANLSDFIFGVSTTYQRFNDPKTSSIKEWSYWLTDSQGRSNGGKLLVLLIDASSSELRDARAQLRAAGIDADVQRSDSTDHMAVRYLSLIPAMYQHPDRKNRKWVVTCDDDTFFPSPHALVERFSHFNTSRPLYVGTLSEDVNNVDRHGAQAFGGAGVFITVPLAAEIAARYESCRTDQKLEESNSGWGPQGDIMLRKCIYENTEVRLSLVPELWQLDLTGDPSGFYESGIKPLSLHHYRGGMWHVAHPYDYTKVAHLCGEDCTLQRFRTNDGFVISTSFSVAQYPRGMDDVDMDQMERTFAPAPDDKGWNLDYALGPQRKNLARTGRKLSWDLQESYSRADGSVVQVYVRKADDPRWVDEDGERMREWDGVIELVWIS